MRERVGDLVPTAVHAFLDGRGALANARAASTELARRRVEREEVTLFLAGLPERGRRRHPA